MARESKSVKAAFDELLNAIEHKTMLGLFKIEEQITERRLTTLQKDLETLKKRGAERLKNFDSNATNG